MNAYEELKQHLQEASVRSVPSEEYLHLKGLWDKYKKLGFRRKAFRVGKEMAKIRPARHGDFLWVILKLTRIKVRRVGRNYRDAETFDGITLERNEEGRRVLLLIPSGQWLGDIPEEILDHTLQVDHNFESFYVAPVVSGHDGEYNCFVTSDLENVASGQLDPILLGSMGFELETRWPVHFAVLGVWGTDWHDINLSTDRLGIETGRGSS